MTGGVEARVAEVLAAHEVRWTTHGDVRPRHVIHCALRGGCDLSLRQKALMSDDDCYEAHRAHVAAAIATALAAEAGDGALRAAVEAAVDDALAGAASWQIVSGQGMWALSLYAARKAAKRAVRAALAQSAPADDEGGVW